MALKQVAGTPAGYRMLARGDRGEIYLYGIVGGDWFGEGITATQFAKDLKALGNVSTIDLRINSEGGSVFDGKAIYSLLVDHKAKVITHVDGLAASAASYIAMAGDEIEIAEAAFFMVHNARGVVFGEAEDIRKHADMLDQVNASMVELYAARTKQDAKKIKKWMDDETWFDGKQSVQNGFADRIVENLKVAACVTRPGTFKHLPTALMPRRSAAAAAIEKMTALIKR